MSTSLMQSPEPGEERNQRWAAMLVGAVVVVAAVLVIWLFARSSGGTGPKAAAPPPYAALVKLTEIKMSTAQNFVGATVTYLEGKITNSGDKSVTRAIAEITFRNSLDQVAQQEQLPIMVIEDRPGYSDAVGLNLLPLAPGQSRHFRLTFEHVTADWNQAYPELRIVDVSVK